MALIPQASCCLICPFITCFLSRLELPAIVLTSGNLSDEPVIIDNNDAIEHLGSVADAFLIYNREIYNRTDDSVMMFTGEPGQADQEVTGICTLTGKSPG